MSANVEYTTVLTSTLDTTTVYLYVVEGSILLVFNVIAAVFIFATKALATQKEFVLFAINMLFDAIFGSAYLVAGIFNLVLFYNEVYFPWRERLYCFFCGHVQLFIIVTPAVGIISLANAIDRLLSVYLPIKYFQWSRNYSYYVGFIVCSCVVPCYAAAFIAAFNTRTELVNGLCLLQWAVTPAMYTSLRVIRISASIFGATLYIPILWKLRQLNLASNHHLSDTQKRRLTRTTFTVSLITFNELILFTVPDVYVIVAPSSSNLLFFLMNLNKGIVNMVIFLWTQRELRRSILNFVRMKRGVTSHSVVKIQSTQQPR